jgi:prolyl-tRNA synthetase
VEIGPKDLEQGQLALARRITPEGAKRKEFVPEAEAVTTMPARLDAFQAELLDAARRRREAHTHRGAKTIDEVREILDGDGGFVFTGWSGDPAVEQRMKDVARATSRVVPGEEFRSATPPERCVSGEGPSRMEVVWARAY